MKRGFFFYLWIQIRTCIFRRRWLAVFPVMAFIGYRMLNFLKYRAEAFPVSGVHGPLYHAWDALFVAFGNGQYVVFVVVNLFIFLVCDLLPETGLGQLSLVRLGSRDQWWLAKCLTVFCAALVYVLLSGLIILAFSVFLFPLDLSWSPGVLHDPWAMNVPAYVLNTLSVPETLLIILALLVAGLSGLGILEMVITQVTRRYLIGYITAVVVLLASYAVSWISEAPVLAKIFIYKYLMFNNFPFPFRDTFLKESFLYWAIWFVVFIGWGFYLSRRQDHLALRH